MNRRLEGDFELDDNPARVDTEELHRFLSTEAYWAIGRPREKVEQLVLESARVIGLYAPDGSQAGFCRVVTDGNSIAYLADVYVHPEFRGRGFGAALVREAVVDGPHSDVRWVLHTDDPEFYVQFGFGPPGARLMERPKPGSEPGAR